MSATLKSRYAFGMQRTPRLRELTRIARVLARGPVPATNVPRRFALARRRSSAPVRPAGAVLRFHVA